MARRLGQHFLIRHNLLERIAAAACPSLEPLVIEIGPGQGALTGHLLPRAGRVVAIELDAALAGGLARRFPEAAHLEVLHADVLDADLRQWGPAVVAGNLPYYISSPILERILSLGPLWKRAVVLVQREVAERLTAVPGTRDYGFLSVRTQLAATAEILFRVPPSAFRPPPKVDSAVVRLTPKPAAPIPDGLIEFVGRCFLHKRKTLRNNLAPFYGKETVEAWPEASLRAEQLPVERFVQLFERLAYHGI